MKKPSTLLAFILFLGTCGLLFAKSDSVDVTEDSSSPLMMAEHEGPFKKAPNSNPSQTSGISEFELHQRAREATEPENEARRENQSASLTPQENPSDSASSSTPPPRYNINRESLLPEPNRSTLPSGPTVATKIPGANSAFVVFKSPEYFESKFKRKRAAILQAELAKVKQLRVAQTQIANKEKWIRFISTTTNLGKILATSKNQFIGAKEDFFDDTGCCNTGTKKMKRFLTKLRQKIETVDTQHPNLTGNDTTQIKNELVSQIDLTKQMLEDLNYGIILGTGTAGAAGYAIPAIIHAAFCKSALPLSLICPTAVPFTLAAGTLAAMGSYAYLENGKNRLYRQSLREMEATTARIGAIRERNRNLNINVSHTANLALWLTTELTQFARDLH